MLYKQAQNTIPFMQIISDISSLDIGREDRVLAVFPHPDDESVYAGGLLHLLTEAGVFIHLLILTKGEKSTLRFGLNRDEDLGSIRENEARKASEILGISSLFVGSFPDGGIASECDAIKKHLKNVCLIQKPSILLTLEPSGIYGHPDHITTTNIITMVAREQQLKLLFATVQGEIYNPSAAARKMAQPNHVFVPLPPTFKLTLRSDVADIKLRAIGAHRSQHVIDEAFKEKWEKRELLASEFYTFDK